jgi:VWFA-related protein
MRRHLRVALALALAVLPAGAIISGQQSPQTPTFRVAVDFVEVDVLVTDSQGNYVRDLTKDDFQVFEDGKPQMVSNFVAIDIPVERGQQPLFTNRVVDPDVQSNERPFGGRVYVMVLDSAHTLPQNTNLMRLAAKKFINEKLGANDLMAVVTARGAAGGAEDGQEFTNNKRLLTAAVEKFRGTQPRSATINKIEDLMNTAPIRQAMRASGGTPPEPVDIDAKEREFNARAVLDELTAVADWFSVVHGRKKSILFFSEGISYDIHDVFANGGNNGAAQIQQRMQDLVRAATKANASIYSIDPRGLMGLSDASIELQGVDPTDAPGQILDQRALQNEDRLARESLQAFSAETGGFAVVNTNRLANAFDRILDENSSYYVLAYYPPNPKRDGKYHNINVRVNRPGLNVRFRKGYANQTGKPPAPSSGALPVDLVEALRSPVPVSGLGMKVFAAPFKGMASNASVLMGVELRGRDLTTSGTGVIDIAYSAVDVRGRSKASSRDTLTLNLRPETKERVAKDGIRFLYRLELPPGRYQLRIAAHDAATGAVGSLLYDLDVPDFAKEKLAMSGLVLTSAAASIMPTARPDDELRMLLPGPPAGVRTFAQNDQLALFADVYDNDVTTAHKVDITTSLTADAGRVVFKNEEERSTADLGGKPGGFGVGTTLSLSDFDPGLYVLRVEARSRLGSGATASREVQIQITAPESKAGQQK